jgi:hypothetical protein
MFALFAPGKVENTDKKFYIAARIVVGGCSAGDESAAMTLFKKRSYIYLLNPAIYSSPMFFTFSSL